MIFYDFISENVRRLIEYLKHGNYFYGHLFFCCDDTTIKMVRKPVKKQEENPAGCAGEGKQSKGNTGEEKRTVDSAKIEFCDKITRRRCEGKGEWVCGREGGRRNGKCEKGERSLRFKQVS